jgi:hypothetical protein
MDRALIALPAALSLAYLPYFFHDFCLGPRFLYAGMPAFAILSARGLQGAGLAVARRWKRSPRRGLAAVTQVAAICVAAGLVVNLPPLLLWYGADFWGVGPSLVDEVRARGIHNAVVFIRDHPHARKQELLLLGVSRPTAQAAVEVLDGAWVDGEMEAARRLPGDAASYARRLEERLAAATLDPSRSRFRTEPIWRDPRGRSSNVHLGFLANTPWPERQDVIYALDLGERNRVLIEAHPERAAWLYAWDDEAGRFRLRRNKW